VDAIAHRGVTAAMLAHRIALASTEEQRARWAQLIAQSAYGAGLADDPEFRSAFVTYVEWGTRIAKANSAPGADPPTDYPTPRWGWGEAPPPPADRFRRAPGRPRGARRSGGAG